MRKKSELLEKSNIFEKFVIRQTGNKVNVLKLDNSCEYLKTFPKVYKRSMCNSQLPIIITNRKRRADHPVDGEEVLFGNVVADYDWCPEMRRSRSGTAYMSKGRPIRWSSQRHNIVAFWAAKAKYTAQIEKRFCVNAKWRTNLLVYSAAKHRGIINNEVKYIAITHEKKNYLAALYANWIRNSYWEYTDLWRESVRNQVRWLTKLHKLSKHINVRVRFVRDVLSHKVIEI